MKITEVRVRLVKNKDERLKAFCSMTLDNEFVVRDIKIIAGAAGYFVAMPSRKMSDHCENCGGKNHLKARFCNDCGRSLPQDRTKRDAQGRMKLHADIAHPANADSRQRIQETVVAAFKQEQRKAKTPGYEPLAMDEPDDDIPETVT